ncbi:MAG: DEAD/DEAH box helicase [Myxococcales bacterium]|nr:DEAD/DEAH box helicase [Myxococcales bacterium]
MSASLEDRVGPAMASALLKKGYAELTPVQEAVLAPELAGHDVRLSSQTGSGKTVAIGLLLREAVEAHASRTVRLAPPVALVVTPTRELAKQVEEELGWLFSPYGVAVTSVTGGASYRDERRALSGSPAVVVGTPGRLLDHLGRGALSLAGLHAVVLDEADRMLDMGFRDDIEAIFAQAPEGRRTHLVSATFPREVKALADSVQHEPREVFGSPRGAANLDIEHVVHVIDARDRFDALVNLLLAHPDEQMLVFARTRADVAHVTSELMQAGFMVSSLSGEMEQAERNRALAAFKTGRYRALIATDVAARGIDVAGIARVIHFEPPNDRDSYTHRSGRTGRAGRKGVSSILVAPAGLSRALSLLTRLGLEPRFEPIPGPEEIRALGGARWYDDLTADDPDGIVVPFEAATWALAKSLAAHPSVVRVIARLLVRAGQMGPTEPRELAQPDPESLRRRYGSAGGRPPRAQRQATEWVSFHVSWGEERGADPRRLLALSCRRGQIRGSDVGSIRVLRRHSIVDVTAAAAGDFATHACRPDPREPHIQIRPMTGAESQRPTAPRRGPPPRHFDRKKKPPKR